MTATSKAEFSDQRELEANSELRFESPKGCTVRLVSGTAEIFGAELTSARAYRLPANSNVAVTTWHGCKLSLAGDVQECYVSKDISALSLYLNLHGVLRNVRDSVQPDHEAEFTGQSDASPSRADDGDSTGPRVLVVGGQDVGKSTLCRMLANWAARDGHEPVLVDLDVGQNQLVVPGAIGALLVRRPSQPDDNGWFTEQPACALHFGNVCPSDNVALYTNMIVVMAMTVNFRIENNIRSLTGGLIVNTCGWIHGEGYDCIVGIVKAFDIDLICVIDNERLHSRLREDFAAKDGEQEPGVQGMPNVILLPKSGGVVSKNKDRGGQLRCARIREYFYGSPAKPFYPHSCRVRIALPRTGASTSSTCELEPGLCVIYRVGMDKVPTGCLPIGMEETENGKQVTRYKGPLANLVNYVLSISYAKTPDAVLNQIVAGFLVVTGVEQDIRADATHAFIEVLSPQRLPLPGHILLHSKASFVDAT